MDRTPPFSIEIKITDNNGKKIYHWKAGRSNIVAGLEQTLKFVKDKLGVEVKRGYDAKQALEMLVGKR
ncbi:hypothetical protein DRN85_07865 [Methanosarcinales archaeon]|nr:MAG: hypothetical protein DRN85_07865 [Methanosarcinales archaeon]